MIKLILSIVFSWILFVSGCLYAGSKITNPQIGFKIKPVLQVVTSDSVGIMWESYAADSGIVKFSTNSDMSQAISLNDSSVSKIHKLKIQKLMPNVRYYYVVISNGQTSKIESFITAPSKGAKTPFRFIVYGDSRRSFQQWMANFTGVKYGTAIDHLNVCQSIISYVPNFLVHTGDYVTSGKDMKDIYEFFDIEKDLLNKYPLTGVYGNHDIIGGSDEKHTYLSNYFIPPEGGTFSWYPYNYGNIHFVMLNSNSDLTYGSKQYEFLKKDLEAASSNPDIDHIFVILHQAIFSISYHGDSDKLIKVLTPLFERHRVKAVFYGHDHDYQHLENNGIHYIVTGGAGAPVYDPPVNKYTDKNTKAHLIIYRPCLNYVIVDVNGISLNFESRKVQGNGNSTSSVIERFRIQ